MDFCSFRLRCHACEPLSDFVVLEDWSRRSKVSSCLFYSIDLEIEIEIGFAMDKWFACPGSTIPFLFVCLFVNTTWVRREIRL